MSRSKSGKKAAFIASAGDIASEIFVIDSQFRRVASGVGRLETPLPPGIYKVKVRTGRNSQEKYLEVLEGKPPDPMVFEPASFASPAPLNQTAKTHEYHVAARGPSRNPPRDIGKGTGGSLFILARDWSGKDDIRLRNPSLAHPAHGLKVRNADGSLLADLQSLSQDNLKEARRDARKPKADREKIDPWAACHVALEPKPYLLSLETPSGHLEQTVVVSSGWQTQVYLTQSAYIPGHDDLLPDLPRASIQMTRPGAAPPDDDSQKRLVELARLGLTDRRDVVSDALLNEILFGKFENPMLGILGAHILLRRKKPDLKSLRTIVKNLRNLLGKGTHPDVEALALRLDGRSAYEFSVPPMLRRSWKILIPRTVSRPELIPSESLAARVAHLMWAGEPWLLWMRPASIEKSREDYLEGIREQLGPALPSASARRSSKKAASTSTRVTRRKPAIGEPAMKQLVQNLYLPRSVVQGMLDESD